MSAAENGTPAYRIVTLPGLGRVQMPAHIRNAQVLAEVLGEDAEATPEKKTRKKP